MIISALINNITLIISLSILYRFIVRRWKYGSRTGQVISGFLFGAVAVVGMLNPLIVSPGLIFDGRSIIISIAGFIGGWVTALIAALMGVIYRVWLGGPGAIMGVSVIASSAIVGIAYHYIRQRRPHVATPLHLIGFGIIVHICTLALTMTLPSSMKYEVLSNIAIPVILIYPLGTLLVCVVLLDLESRIGAEDALQESEERFRTLIDKTPLGMSLIDMDGRYEYVNPAFVKIFGYDLSDIPTGKEWFRTAYPDPEYRREVMADWKEDLSAYPKLEIRPRIYEVMCKGGAFRTIMFRPVTLPSGKQFIIYEDITDRKQAEEELRRNQDVAERLAQEIAIIAEIGKVVGSTLDTEEIYERFAAEVRKLIPFDRLSVNLHDLDRGILRPVYVSGEYIAGRQPGEAFPLKGSVSEVLVRTRSGMFSHPLSVEEMDRRFPDHTATIKAGMRSLLSVPLISRDEVIASLHFRSRKPNVYTEQDLRLAERIGEQIAGAIANAQFYAGLKKTEQELKESEQRYRELSIIDDLTQLYNSRHFYFQLKSETERSNRYGQPLTLLLLDLDNFKHFNDTYGHVEGDQVLRRLGQVVKRCLRETDSAYRYGGEEFTIVLPMTTSADGAITAERIRTEFKKETFSPVSGQEVHMTVSIGLAQYRPQEDMKVFVHRVDQLMYQGKKEGKDRVCSESSPQEPFKWQSSIQFDIERH